MNSYVGNSPTTGHFPTDTFTSSGGSTYTLSQAPATLGSIEVSVQGVLQAVSAYSISGTTLTLAGVTSGDVIFVRHLGETLQIPTTGDGAITTVKIAADAVTGAKIADNAVGNEHLEDDTVGIAELSATGTASNTTFLRGDNSWQTAGSTSASDLTSGTLPIARIADDAITTAKIAPDAITGAEIADDACNSEHYTDGSVDNVHLATGIDAAKLTTGTLPMARLSGTLPALNGSALTNLPAEITKSSSNPATNTNPSGGVGTVFLNTTSGEMFVCTTATSNANVWTNIGDGTGTIEPYTMPSATGGTTGTYTDNSVSYKFHKFTSTGTTNFAISSLGTAPSIDILVIAGGGGGGAGLNNASNGGGGGAGGLRWFTAQTPTASTYVATVGAGGSAATNTVGGMGTNSSFIGTNISITGSGGAGGKRGSDTPVAGGSGAGASRIGTDSGTVVSGGAGNTGSYTPPEGFAGGTCNHQSGAGGGGGSGGAGGNEVGNNGGGFGGPGEDNFLNQSSTAFTVASTKLLLDAVSLGEVSGSSRHIAAGGGGGWSDGSPGNNAGGIGGGGNGGLNQGTVAPTASLVNTGSGGGGGYHANSISGSAGSSGVVIVRYRAS